MATKSPKKLVRGDSEPADEAARPAKRARMPIPLHADITALIERICDVEMLRRHVETNEFDERGLQLETLDTFKIKQGLTWLRAIEQELLKISASPESLAALSQSCFKALGFAGPGSKPIDTLEKMKAKVEALETLVDVECVYSRLLRIAAGGGKKKEEPSDEEYEGEEPAALIEADEAAQKKKRPTTPFFRFIAERRDGLAADLRKELGTESMRPTEVVKRASEIWKALSDEEKAPYEDPYKAERAAYDKEKEDKKAKEEAEAWEADPLTQRQYRMLGCHLAPISRGSAVWCMIAESVLGTQQEVMAPDARFVRVDKIFSISRSSEEKYYAKMAQSSNRRLLWYGGPLAGMAGVLSNGVRLPQPETPFSEYNFGKGIYFSDMVSVAAEKSGAADADTAIILLCEVALGKSVERSQADSRGSSKLPPGYASTIGRGLLAPSGSRALPDGVHLPLGPVEEQPPQMGAPAGKRLPHNEYVLYNPANVRMRYLLEVRLLKNQGSESQEAIKEARAETLSLTEGATAPLCSKRLGKKTAADQTLLAR